MNKKVEVMWDDNPLDVSTEVNFIWSIASKLRGPYQSDKYKDVIIPMTIIRRFECALEETKDKVVKKNKENPNYPIKAMYKEAGYQFFNKSEFTLAKLINDSDNIAANFKNYIANFSPNIIDIITSLDFDKQIDKMDKNNRLLSVVKAFSELDLNPKTIDNMKMGYIFEELIRKFSENAEAGDHYTGRDIIKTMVNVLLAEGCDDIFDDGKVITILDQACGTGGMLSTSYNFIKRFNPSADIRLYGQEINPESYAICLAEMLIKGQSADNIKLQDTMKADCFKNDKMRFIIENPPFGQSWGGKDAAEGVEDAVNNEHDKGESGRFGIGLPSTSDMQLLFLQSALDKMDDKNGRAAIIQSGSPLFAGGTSSGESQIRKYLLLNDMIEAIIALPIDLFYNTGIATYIWILSKNKRKERMGKIQLIDATNQCEKLRKSLGDKKNEITSKNRKYITELYSKFEENEFSKIYENEFFIYKEYTVMQPLQRSYSITIESIQNLKLSGKISNFYDENKVLELETNDDKTEKEVKKLNDLLSNKEKYERLLSILNENISSNVYKDVDIFKKYLNNLLLNDDFNTKLVEKIVEGLSVIDKTAKIHTNKKGEVIYDKDTKDVEYIKYNETIDIYMEREVLPFIPDAKAFFEEKLDSKKPIIKIGAEIPLTKCFYKFKKPQSSNDLKDEFNNIEIQLRKSIDEIF